MKSYGPTTYACKSCNSVLYNKGFDTFYERCQHVHEKIESKLEPILWSQNELRRLSGWLRVKVSHEMKRRLWMFNRADWMDTRDFWLNIENLTFEPVLKKDGKSFNPVLFEYFKSTIALAEVVYNKGWTEKKE